MTNSRVRDIFLAAIELEGSARDAHLAEACGNDAALRAEVDKLLAADERGQARKQDHSTTPLQPGAGDQGTSGSSGVIGVGVGDSIDGFKILEVIGEGGMGVVYLAEQVTPVKRRIALKVIKPGMDSKAVLARFEAERQALALMDHPGIARVLQAGTTDRGLPYFAMEYVKGVPITEAADHHQLNTTQRLELMQKVCDAVQHAHMKGVIHRDLKPSNILVTSNAKDELVAKIIDFGVAKATAQQLTELTVHTQVGHFIGTPAYMSPEQADLTAADIDTRTDVYSLGVILYELLAGQLPFDPDELRNAGLEEMRRRIREDDPPKPSTRLIGLDEQTATRISKARRTRLDQLQKNLASELEWIPLKAMRKLRSDRYATPTDLGSDIQRYLDGEPLEAGPESAGYRLRKFVVRRRVPILVSVAFVGQLIVATAVVSSWYAVEVERQRVEAEQERQVTDAVLERTLEMQKASIPRLAYELLLDRFYADKPIVNPRDGEDDLPFLNLLDDLVDAIDTDPQSYRQKFKEQTKGNDVPALEDYETQLSRFLGRLQEWTLFKGKEAKFLAVLKEKENRLGESQDLMRQAKSYPLMWSGRYEEVRDLWAVAPQDNQAFGWTGAAYLREGNASAAIMNLKQWSNAQIGHPSPWATALLAEAYAMLGDEDSARRSIEAWEAIKTFNAEWSFKNERFGKFASWIAQVESIGQAKILLGEEEDGLEMMRQARDRLSLILGWEHPRFNRINEWLAEAENDEPAIDEAGGD